MESYGGFGIWKGHIWGPPRWVFTFKDKWSHWVPASCEWAPSAHTGFLNAHQNNLSKPRDTFLRRLMWGQIGNHFNKIPLRWNCISQESERGAEPGETPTVEVLPEVFQHCLKRGDLLCWQIYRGCSRPRCVQVQTLDWGTAEARRGQTHSERQKPFMKSLSKPRGRRRKPSAACLFLHAVFLRVEKTITSWALRRPSYFNYIAPKFPRPATPSLHKHTHSDGITLHANRPTPRAM